MQEDEENYTELTRDEVAEWVKRGSEKSIDEIPTFIKYMKERIPESYGNAVYMVSIASAVVAQIMARDQGITGFQAGCVQWDWIRH